MEGQCPRPPPYTYRIEFTHADTLRKMGAETSLGASGQHAAQGPEHGAGAQRRDAQPPLPRQQRTGGLQQHGRVVEKVGGQTVSLALGLECGSEAMGAEDGGDPLGRLREDGKEDGGGGRGAGVADADAWSRRSVSAGRTRILMPPSQGLVRTFEDGPGGKHAGDRAGKGLERVLDERLHVRNAAVGKGDGSERTYI